ncbi:MAG: hypothetical protein ACXVPK_11560 [Tumebacillaceae bacterium]
MSYFSIGTILFLLYLLYNWRRDREISSDGLIGLVVIWLLQLVFAFAGYAVYLLVGGVIGTFAVCWLLRRVHAGKKSFFPMVGLILAALFYIEYCNGVETFGSVAEFRTWESPLKSYYHLVPYKVVHRSNRQATPTADLFYLPEMIGQLLTPTQLKQEQGKLFYYETNGFGESGRWFEYGVSKASQVQ